MLFAFCGILRRFEQEMAQVVCRAEFSVSLFAVCTISAVDAAERQKTGKKSKRFFVLRGSGLSDAVGSFDR